MAGKDSLTLKVALEASTKQYRTAMQDATKETQKFSSSMDKASESAGNYRDKQGRLRNEFGRFVADTEKASNGIGGLTRSIGALVASAAGLAGVTAGLRGIISTGAQFEALSGQVAGLMGSLISGNAAVAWIQDFATRTPFQLDGVTQAFIKLRAFGLDPMDGTMLALADTAARLGGEQETLEGVILAVGQAWSKQKLQGEEILQLVERGVPVWDLLEKVTGKNVEALQKLSSEGKLGRDVIAALVAEMGKVNSGAAVSAMDSFNGRLSNLQDSWAAALNTIAQAGVLDAASAVLTDLGNRVRALIASGDLQAWGQRVGAAMRVVYDLVAALLGTLADWSGAIRVLAIAWALAKVWLWAPIIADVARSAVKAAVATSLMSGSIAGLGKALAFLGAAYAIDRIADEFLFAGDAAQEAKDAAGNLSIELLYVRQELGKMGAEGKAAGEEINALWREFQDGAITADEALKAANEVMLRIQRQGELSAKQAKDAIEQTRKVAQAEGVLSQERQRLAGLHASRVDELAKTEIRAAQAALKSNREAAEKSLAARKDALARGEAAEQRYASEVERLRERMADAAKASEDKQREARLAGLSDYQRQRALIAEIAAELQKARGLGLQGQAAEAAAAAEKAAALAGELTNARKRKQLLEEATALAQFQRQQELAAAEEAEAAQKKANAANRQAIAQEEQTIEAHRSAIEGLQAQIAALTDGDKIVKIDVDIRGAEAKIAKLQADLDALNATPAVARAGGGAVPGRAGGGAIRRYAGGGTPRTLRPGMIRGPGSRTSDSILARVSNGEHAFITRAARAQRLWPLLNTLNFASDAVVDRLLANLPAGLTNPPRLTPAAAGAYAGGGPVTGGASETVNINLSIGRSAVRLQGARDQANALADALRELSRGQ